MLLNDYQLSNAHVGYDLSNLNTSIDYLINRSINYQNNLANLQAYSSPTVIRTLPFAAGAAAADGPFPFGDTAALVGIGGAASYDLYSNLKHLPIFNESSSSQRPTKIPNEGKPDSQHISPSSGQERWYGPDGKPVKDIDHDHGQGVPHVHDWQRDTNGKPIRGSGRPYNPNIDKYKR